MSRAFAGKRGGGGKRGQRGRAGRAAPLELSGVARGVGGSRPPSGSSPGRADTGWVRRRAGGGPGRGDSSVRGLSRVTVAEPPARREGFPREGACPARGFTSVERINDDSRRPLTSGLDFFFSFSSTPGKTPSFVRPVTADVFAADLTDNTYFFFKLEVRWPWRFDG